MWQARCEALHAAQAQEEADVTRRLSAMASEVDADHASAMRGWRAREGSLKRELAAQREAAGKERKALAREHEREVGSLRSALAWR